MSNIIYEYGNSLYLNLTNKCPCDCSFCIRRNTDGMGSAKSLWLKNEPCIEQIISQLTATGFKRYDEIVFCGFGEPFCALDNMLKVCRYLRARSGSPPIRVNTNGLGDLINQKSTAPSLHGLVDVISVSLNAPDKKKYNEMCRPSFGEDAFDAMLKFAQDCKKYVPNVQFSVVNTISDEDIEECREIARKLGIPLRVRTAE